MKDLYNVPLNLYHTLISIDIFTYFDLFYPRFLLTSAFHSFCITNLKETRNSGFWTQRLQGNCWKRLFRPFRLESRIRDYVLLSMTSQSLQAPTFTVLSPIDTELKDVSSRFVRVVNHNKMVHCDRYMDIVEELLGIKPYQESDDSETEDDIPAETNTTSEQSVKE